MKICLNRGTAGAGLPLEQFVDLAADAGFPGADVDLSYAADYSVSALADLYAKSNLSFGGWSPPHDFRAEPSKMTEGLRRLETFAAAARELNIDACGTYILPSADLPFMENWAFHVRMIKPIAERLAAHGLRFGLEFVSPHHLRHKFKHEFIITPGLMLELADVIGSNVGLLVDSFHLHCAGEPNAHLKRIPLDKIVFCHLNDAPGLPLHDVEDGKRLLPGQGVIDIRGFLSTLTEMGFNGVMSLEVFNAELRAMAPKDAAKKAWQATLPYVA